ncbi:MAG TPA: ribosome biogenesis GTPase YlqF, partial [Rheinheimera sp.]|nr:ribosome biogenesis GTPase YlqF [Rheinheimera sp.]
TGAIKDTVFDYADIAMFAADYLLQTYPDAVMQRFGLTELPENDIALMDAIGIKRGAMRKGGIVDLEKVGSILITELRAGNLGGITLETPEMVSQELIAAKAEEAAKAKEKAEREAERKRKAQKKYR